MTLKNRLMIAAGFAAAIFLAACQQPSSSPSSSPSPRPSVTASAPISGSSLVAPTPTPSFSNCTFFMMPGAERRGCPDVVIRVTSIGDNKDIYPKIEISSNGENWTTFDRAMYKAPVGVERSFDGKVWQVKVTVHEVVGAKLVSACQGGDVDPSSCRDFDDPNRLGLIIGTPLPKDDFLMIYLKLPKS